jgi:hypothetical protein
MKKGMRMRNKKGYYRLDDIAAYFFAFAIIAIGIAAAVIGFYGQDIDIRGEEARVMNYKIYNVIRDRDNFNIDAFEKNFDLLGAAGIDKKVFNNGNYYYHVEILGGYEELEIFDGNPDYAVECKLELEKQDRKASSVFPICHLTTEKIAGGATLKILTASNQKGERI